MPLGMGVGFSPRGLCFCTRWGPTLLRQRGLSPLVFSPCLLQPYGCMDQDATWYGGRRRPRGHCVRWGPSFAVPKKGAEPPPQFSAHVYCGQTAPWIQMARGMEVGLSPGHIVLDGDPAILPKKGGRASSFWPIFIMAKRLDASRCHLIRR